MFLAFRELRFSKLRYFLIGFIMILIGWLVFIISGLANGLSADNASAIQNMNADHIVIQPEAENKLNRSQITEEQVKQVQQQPFIKASAPLGQKMLSVTKVDSTEKMDITIFATDATGILAPKIVEGTNISNNVNEQAVVDISLKEEGIKLGDWIKDPDTGQKWKVVGFTEGQTFSHSPVVFLNLNDWKSLISNNTKGKQVYYSAVALQMDENKVTDLTKEVKDIQVITKDDALQNIPGFKEEQGSLNMMIVFLIVIASFVQAVFFYVITLQKTNQFGVLKAIGTKTSYLARNLIGQVILLTTVALAFSIAFTYGTQMILPESMPFELNTTMFVQVSVVLLVVSILGSLLSLYRIAKVDAIEAIGRAA